MVPLPEWLDDADAPERREDSILIAIALAAFLFYLGAALACRF